MMMKKKKFKRKRPAQSCLTLPPIPRVRVVLQQFVVERLDSRGYVLYRSFLTSMESLEAHLLCEESKMGWTTVCINKQRNKKRLILLSRQRNKTKQKNHPIFFFFLIVNLSLNVPHVVV